MKLKFLNLKYLILILTLPCVDCCCVGTTGSPKERLLLCDHAVRRLYWTEPPALPGRRPSLRFGSRTGATTRESLESIRDGFDIELPPESRSIRFQDIVNVRRGDTVDPLKEVKTGKVAKLGSSNLRRTLTKPSDLAVCIVLTLEDRTFDIQCFSEADFSKLYTPLHAYVAKLIRNAEESP